MLFWIPMVISKWSQVLFRLDIYCWIWWLYTVYATGQGFYILLHDPWWVFFVSSRLINPYWRILGHEWDHFTGKPTQSWILEFLGKTQADFWITNPKQSIESKNNILSGNWNLPKRVNHFKIFRNSSVPFGDCTVSNDIEIIYLAR